MANAWTDRIFVSKIAENGGPVRRKLSSIDKNSSRTAVRNECASRGYHIVEIGDHWLIFHKSLKVQTVL